MKNKINIAEILKDCPSGMELDCLLFKDTPVYFQRITNACYYPIEIKVEYPDGSFEIFELSKEGCIYDRITAKCVIFPKGKTTWEGFQRPFKDGNVIFTTLGNIAIIKKPIEEKLFHVYVIMVGNGFYKDATTKVVVERLATEEEKEKLFKAIKEHGYKWNETTKTLEKLVKPKFKVGDIVKSTFNNNKYVIKEVTDTSYTLVEVTNKFRYIEPINEDKNWELVPNKFDINTLIPFESRVLVRPNRDGKWCGSFFSHIDEDFRLRGNKFVTTAVKNYPMCIPYEGNEHLLGTTNDCDEFYKTWEE